MELPVGWLRHNFLQPSETFIYTSMCSLRDAGVPIRVLAINRYQEQLFPWPDVTVLADNPIEAASYWLAGWSPRQDRWARSVRLIHAHMGTSGAHILGAVRRHRIPLVTSFYGQDVTIAGSPEGQRPINWPYMLQRRRLFRRGARFVVLSRHMRAALAAQGCPEDKLRIVRLGVDLSRFDPADHVPSAGTSDGPPLRVLMVGREVDKKGFDDGLRACAQARDAGVPLTVTLLGTNSPLRPELQQLAATLRLPVAWPDPRSSVPAAMAEADVLLVPSRTAADGDQEGTPTVICEGAAAGLPIVSTLHAGIPEQVEHGVTGLLTPERDVAGLARALTDLAGDPQRRRALGLAGRAKMQTEYSLTAHRDALLAVYHELLS